LNEQTTRAKESRPNKEFVKDGRSSQYRAMQRKHHEELTNSYQGVYSAGAAVVYEELKNKGIIPDPKPIRADEENLDKSRYCAYHKAHGHNTDQCWNLISALLKLIDDPQVRRFTRMDTGNRRPRNDERMNLGDEPDFRPNPRRANEHHHEILTISQEQRGETSVSGGRKRTASRRDEEHLVHIPIRRSGPPTRVNTSRESSSVSRRQVKAYVRKAYSTGHQ
ncbi:Unknown protein, partial [Striga hermonthica]